MDEIKQSMDEYVEKVLTFGEDIKEAGINFARDFSSNFQSLLFEGFTTGKFKIKDFMLNFAHSVIGNITEGFTTAMTGPDSFIGKMMESLGGMLFGSGKAAGGSANSGIGSIFSG